MFRPWMFRDPELVFGLPVLLVAAVIFPLHLGWIGTPLLAVTGYLAAVAIILSVAEALDKPDRYANWISNILQPILIFCALAIPCGLAFAVGSVAGGADERFDDEICASRGAGESQDPLTELDDMLDVTADCDQSPG